MFMAAATPELTNGAIATHSDHSTSQVGDPPPNLQSKAK
jgi:hypothetical protein